ncbi:hypothetical protein IEQ34_003062 [Dendrobium chrysotoxum]|uniref:AP2/ERF domain-containing protein n=1 Tax=Dendrobium chrysotoxum TaxID=161865 RepID=A0AAV7H2M4_DENCH|nr:hypothetical protein IEQ34_003062 [Dendrobium chrysotoxum]
MVQKIGSRKNLDPTEKINETVSKPLSISIGQQQQQQRKRYMGVRQSPSGRWVAEIKGTAQKIRLWLGTFDTAEVAAHAYDEAACLLRGANTRTNFWPRNKGGFGGSGSSNTGSSSVLSTKVLNQLLEHLEAQRATKSSHCLSSAPSTSPLFPPPPPPPPQNQQQHHKHNQELELIKRMAYGELFSDVGTSIATTHDEIMKGKVQRAVNLVDMDLRLEDFSCFFAPFEIEGRERVEIGTYEYWSMLSAAANGV